MDNDHDRLRRLYQGYVAGRKPRSREKCPTPSETAESFEPGAPGRLKRRIVDHIASCPSCREEFTILLERERQAATPVPAARSVREDDAHPRARPPRSIGRVPLWRLAGAAIGLGLIVASLVTVRRQWELVSALRSARPGILLLAPRSGQVISRPFAFRWQSQPQAESYVLEIFDEAMLPIWTSGRVTDATIQIPAEAIFLLSAGKSYYWMVTGFAGRAKTGESPLGRFTVPR